ncbi:resistance-nodulation-cell division efflux transporter [Lysobacter helvus]|uniref:Resistance-nodulation-cell division efflux transporter n=2 Tax=Lysobacteraceae TaxID=32033 RepID=A0ABN6FPW1_9GAMM|nr:MULTISPECIES: efflux RND transporter permease subunit [Lysobacter]BCT91315.1 resistance-nodulation-cell division efflux transporter [Lysobacter caseinilyticus]BCT94468.1 resistance-nodulation-cell division efflux transporter [Lysobacter helvus]
MKDHETKFNLSRWAIAHPQFVLFLMLLFALGGVYSWRHLGQMEDPAFTVKAMVVQAQWPGATADQVAQQVTDRIERKLQEVAEVDYLSSFSKPGVSQITVVLRESVPAKKVPDVWYQVRKKIADIQGTLPEGVRGPAFNDEFGDTFGNLYAFTADGFTYAELRKFVDQARDEFLRVPDVSKVQYIGVQDEKIFVEASSAKLASIGLDPRLIADALQKTNALVPAGVVQAGAQRVAIKATGEFDSVASIANIGVDANGRTLRLGDIARVYRGYTDPVESKMHFDGHDAIGLAIAMRDGGDVIRMGHDLDAAVARVQAAMPVGVEIHAVSNQPEVVHESVHEFTKSLGEAIIIVLAVSFLSLGWRTGIVVALSIPLVLAMTFLVMYAFGIDLQRISLGALIIALGLLVDDAIIAVEMMALKLEQGWDRARAASFAYTATAFPMLTGTLITAAGFLPVGLAKSGAGEYTISIFQVVGIALMLSWLVAVLFTPYLGYKLLPESKGGHAHDAHAVDGTRGFYGIFRRLLEWCLRRRGLVLGWTVAVFIGALALFQAVPQQFFPASSRPELMVDLWLPEAASIAATDDAVSRFEKQVQRDPDVVAVTGYIGMGSPRFYLPLDVQLPNTNFGQVMVMTKGEHEREKVLKRIEAMFAKDFPNVRGRVQRLENGPPVGYPIKLRVSGPDPLKLPAIVDQVQGVLRADPAIRDVNSDMGERLQTMRLVIDQDKARALGVTSQQIADTTQNSLSGVGITQFRENDQLIDVVTRLEGQERTDLDNLKDVKLYVRDGQYVALSQVAHIELGSEQSIVWRRNRMPTVTVRADVSGAEAVDVTQRTWPAIQAIAAKLPLGYRIEVGGAAESSKTSQDSIAAVVPFAVAVILVLLMVQLQDMKKMLLVLGTAPLGMIGVSLVLAVFRVPFGFVAMLGTIALAGMIMRNSVILIDQIDQDLAQGATPWDAIVGATLRRFRPIVLTALAAILAMIPLTRSTFWGPMAWAIMGGLTVATLLTLIVLPTLYAWAYRVKRETPAQVPTPATVATHDDIAPRGLPQTA